jgi:hypothetical protein
LLAIASRRRDTAHVLPLIAACQTNGESLVYVVVGKTNELKIGHSRNVARRLKEFSTGQSLPLRIIAAIPGGHDLERELHTRYAARRLSGEWFRLRVRDVKDELAAYPGAMVFLPGYITADAPTTPPSYAPADPATRVPVGTEGLPSDAGDGAAPTLQASGFWAEIVRIAANAPNTFNPTFDGRR